MSLGEWMLWLALAFSDLTTCTVQGYLYRMGEEVAFTPVNACQGITARTDGTTLVLATPHIWVAVAIPPTRGQVRFAYTWQHDQALIGTEVVPIQWGRVLRG